MATFFENSGRLKVCKEDSRWGMKNGKRSDEELKVKIRGPKGFEIIKLIKRLSFVYYTISYIEANFYFKVNQERSDQLLFF